MTTTVDFYATCAQILLVAWLIVALESPYFRSVIRRYPGSRGFLVSYVGLWIAGGGVAIALCIWSLDEPGTLSEDFDTFITVVTVITACTALYGMGRALFGEGKEPNRLVNANATVQRQDSDEDRQPDLGDRS